MGLVRGGGGAGAQLFFGPVIAPIISICNFLLKMVHFGYLGSDPRMRNKRFDEANIFVHRENQNTGIVVLSVNIRKSR